LRGPGVKPLAFLWQTYKPSLILPSPAFPNDFKAIAMRHYPIFLQLAGRDVVVLGEGIAAERRAAEFGAMGAKVRQASRFSADLLQGVALASGAGAPEEDLRAFSAAAMAAGIPVNIVDRPELSSYITPAIIDRDPLTIAISSGGTAPVLSRLLRGRIEALLAPALGRLALLAERFQAATRARFPNPDLRRRFLAQKIFGGEVGELALAGQEEEAGRAYEQALQVNDDAVTQGIVHLVGAGPGAADLISLRGLRLLGEADVIVHDRLGTAGVLELARRDAQRIDVGKSHGDHTMKQDEINVLLVALAGEGKTVVRLKGGDPFIFGRGGEEVAALRAQGVRFSIVPGITAALACAASAEIPLTHRAQAHAVTFITAHRREHDLPSRVAQFLQPGVTVAIYMGLASLERLCEELSEAGISLDLPAALIESGGTPNSRVLRASLAQIRNEAKSWPMGGPALILLGGTAGEAI